MKTDKRTTDGRKGGRTHGGKHVRTHQQTGGRNERINHQPRPTGKNYEANKRTKDLMNDIGTVKK